MVPDADVMILLGPQQQHGRRSKTESVDRSSILVSCGAFLTDQCLVTQLTPLKTRMCFESRVVVNEYRSGTECHRGTGLDTFL